MSNFATINNQFRIYSAKKFREGLFQNQLSNNNLYLWIGKTDPWPGGSDAPVAPNDTVHERYISFHDMIAMKKVAASGTCLVIPRNNWTSGVIYTQYSDLGGPSLSTNIGCSPTFTYYIDPVNGNDSNSGTSISQAWLTTTLADTIPLTANQSIYYNNAGVWELYREPNETADLGVINANVVTADATGFGPAAPYPTFDLYDPNVSATPFYVLTTDNNVYKCLWNNLGNPSTVKPTGTSSLRFTTGDGYIWKFMFQISASDIQTFLSPSWIPIHVLTSNDGSLQWTVQQTAVPGTIEAIVITNPGSSYSLAPTVTITGDGTGAAATATISSGNIIKILITNPGFGYSYATISLTGNGTAQAIISPPGGHGSDPTNELGAMYIMVNVQLQYDEQGKITVNNSYRKYGLILNPQQYNSQYLFNSLVATLTTNLTLTSVTGTFNPNDIITGALSGASGVVVDYNSTTLVLRLSKVKGIFSTTELINDNSSSAFGSISLITPPDVAFNTGQILYTNNMSPQSRSSEQIENFQITISL